MTIIIATVIIVLSFIFFHYIFSNILIVIFVDIPATIKLGKQKIADKAEILKRLKSILIINITIVLVFLGITYFLFTFYSFGYSISIFIGSIFAIIEVFYKTIMMARSYKRNHAWIDFYKKSYSSFLTTHNIDEIESALNK